MYKPCQYQNSTRQPPNSLKLNNLALFLLLIGCVEIRASWQPIITILKIMYNRLNIRLIVHFIGQIFYE
jgi:hypothetical protein